MKLKAIKAHFVGGKVVGVGQLYEIEDRLGRELVAWGKAVPAPDAPAPRPKRGAMTIESASALVQGAGD